MKRVDAKNLHFNKGHLGISVSDSPIKRLCKNIDGVYKLRLNGFPIYVDNVEDHSDRKCGKIKEVDSRIEEIIQGDHIVFDECHIFKRPIE
ncbi:hypothetical protein C0W80_16060 [Photobacterium leiognathi subsp. mandapamensis]|uniref:hypothetical protein n=1 Tax=Photobacterium leiognathi TaxID=553611 RepID=UPI000D173CB1|nr:hypothetical protein [Photobacterium leiognathi]PSU97839.1 hypothetical protein C0W80_16060 [Photobacterium leiognathi subsp. mandapamensis]